MHWQEIGRSGGRLQLIRRPRHVGAGEEWKEEALARLSLTPFHFTASSGLEEASEGFPSKLGVMRMRQKALGGP